MRLLPVVATAVGVLGIAIVIRIALLATSDASSPASTTTPSVSSAQSGTLVAERTSINSIGRTAADRATQYLPEARQVELVFPSGERVTVELHLFRPDLPVVAVADNLAQMYDELIYAAAGGDAGSARLLFKSLEYCQSAYRNERDLEAAIATLHRDGKFTFPNGVKPPEHVPSGTDNSEFEQRLRHSFEYCSGLTDDQLQQVATWAEAAAHLGDLAGVNRWAREIDNTPEELKLWKRTWDSGYQTAAQRLAIMYRDGVPTDDGIGQPDPKRAYAYQLTAFKLNAAAYASADASMMATMDNVLAEFGSRLNPQEQEEAERMAVEILRETPNCCIVGMLIP